MSRKIVTHHMFPPVPFRTHDWCAFYDGEEEAGGYGYGAEGHDARLDDPAGTYPFKRWWPDVTETVAK